MSSVCIPSPLGFLTIKSSETAIIEISFSKKNKINARNDAILQKCVKELQEYFGGKRSRFSFPIIPEGTDFQKIIWREMSKIPFGKTITYKELAKRAGRPKAIRATASACGKNPIVILIPCHRIITSNGMIGGYSGGIERKRWLLHQESKRR